MGVACGTTAYVNIFDRGTLLRPWRATDLRIEMIMTVLAGFAGGLAGTLWGGIVSAAWLERRPELRALGWRPDGGWRVLQTAVLYGICGGAAGLLFWLGWGLVAFAGTTPWPIIGVIYGGLLWLATALPALSLFAMRLPAVRQACIVMGLEALVAAVSVGLLCAFVWHRAA